MPKLLTDDQLQKIKEAMDLMEKTDKENIKLKAQQIALKGEFDKVCKDNKFLKEKIKELENQLEDFEVVNDDDMGSFFSYLYKKEEKKV